MTRQATQIYLSAEQHRAVQTRAQSTGCSMTEVIRELIDTHLLGDHPPTDLGDLAGAFKSGQPTNVALDRDRMLMHVLSKR